MGLDRESQEQGYRNVLQDIKGGAFADALQAEVDSGFPARALLDKMLEGDNPVSLAEKRVRSKMRLNKEMRPGR